MANTFKSAVLKDVGTSATTLYTTPTATQTTIIGLSVANVSGASVTIDVTFIKGATTVYLVKGAPVPVGGSLVIIGGDQKVVSEANNYIQVKSSAATSIDAIASVLEIA
jgi:hypothetical protein